MDCPLFVLVTRGLEAVAGQELAALPGIRLTASGYRRVAFSSAALQPLLTLRTVDDCFLDVATWQAVAHQRSQLARFAELAATLDLRGCARLVRTLRGLAESPSFAISASFVGSRNYGVAEIKAAIAPVIAARHGWRFSERDADADLNLRIFIEHQDAYLGVRLARSPLHERAYKQIHHPGSLRPPIAAGMLAIAGLRPGERVVDPCCGVGTIAIEATALGAQVVAGDREAGAVLAAARNAGEMRPGLACWDARHLPLASGCADLVACNPPWDRQVAIGSTAATAELYQRLAAQAARVLRPGGRVVLLTSLPDLVRVPGLSLRSSTDISVSGQTPRILCFSRAP